MSRWLIPWGAGSPDDRFGAELIAGISAIFLALAMVFAVQTALDSPQNAVMSALCAFGALVFAANLGLNRRQAWSRIMRWALPAQLMILMFLGAAASRGYRFYNAGWVLCVPLLAIFLVGVRNGAAWAALVVAQALGLWWLEWSGFFVPALAQIEPSVQGSLISTGAMSLLVVGIGISYERAHAARRSALSETIEQLQLAHRELGEAQKKLIAAARMSSLGMLAAGVAHEINNPMAYITSNVAALKRDIHQLGADSQLRDEYADDVLPATLDGIQRINSIVGDLRRFARGDPECFVEYDLNVEISAAVRVAGAELRRRQTQTEVTLGDLPRVTGWPRQTMQVVMNLVTNAAQASAVGGMVRVASWALGDEVVIKVQDCGVGMSPETVSKLFEPFFTTKTVGEGTGLGLAMAHGIVAAQGGRIEVESSAGRGSSFTVLLPTMPPVRLPASIPA